MRICTLILIGVVLYLISAEGTVWETFNSGGTGHDLFLWTVRGSVPAKAPAANLLDLEATEVIQLVIILDYTDCEPHLTSILVIRFVLMTHHALAGDRQEWVSPRFQFPCQCSDMLAMLEANAATSI